MTNTEHPALVALDLIQDALEDAPAKSLPGMAYGFARDAYPALEALIAERDALRAALIETLRSLEQHLDEATRDAGLGHRDMLCPCNENEVVRSRAALAKGEQHR